METTSSPWSRAGDLPPPPAPPPTPVATMPPAGAALPSDFPQGRKQHRRRVWSWVAAGLALAVVVSAATGSIVTFAALHNATNRAAQPSAAAPTSMPAAPQYRPTEASAAKDHLCKVFDLSVRGQEGQGGFRVQGNVNVPIVLRALNSASAVQNALSPAVPADAAAAARKYIGTTLDVTTAAMGNTPTSEVNRLTDLDGDAIDALLDVCGLPR